MISVFAFLYINSLFSDLLTVNRLIYLSALIYSVLISVVFFIMEKDSLVAQFLIYLSISLLFLFGALITQNRPETPATTFIVMLLITPLFMIDKPFFMGIVLSIASTVFLIWMYSVKPYNIWQMDLINVAVFAFVGFFIHIISNSIRIREFVLKRKLNIQKDTDDLTGLKNKGALTKAINDYLEEGSENRGIMFLLDIDGFKSINDTYGHDIGDRVISQLGDYVRNYFTGEEIVGRFGGDEFIFFIKGTDDADTAARIARDIVSGTSVYIALPVEEERIKVSIGIALYHGSEKNYSEIFKKADTALYEAKSDRVDKFRIYE